MAEINFTLTDAEYRALVKRANDERRAPNDMAAYFVVRALGPKRATRTATAPKVRARKAKAS